jgi:hypothetical protein
MSTPCDERDKGLFAACTKITLGNGEKAKFWTERWLNGEAPMTLAPDLRRLAFRKNLTVKNALSNGAWMRGLQRINTADELNQFVILWGKIQEVHLSNTPDLISWTLTADGQYSAASAYEIQFLGRVERNELAKTWKIKAEGKIKFNMWLIIQNRLWTADRLLKRGWPHDDKCCLCDQILETAYHLVLDCPFAKEVWNEFRLQEPTVVQAASNSLSIKDWWEEVQTRCTGPTKKRSITTAAYVIWNIWNERNRRIFKDHKLLPGEVACKTREDLLQLRLAFRH